MYVYNLTVVVNNEELTTWHEWLKNVYLQTVNRSNLVENVRVFKIMDMPEPHYAIHHEQQNPQEMFNFIQGVLTDLLKEAAQQFGEKVLFFGTNLATLTI